MTIVDSKDGGRRRRRPTMSKFYAPPTPKSTVFNKIWSFLLVIIIIIIVIWIIKIWFCSTILGGIVCTILDFIGKLSGFLL